MPSQSTPLRQHVTATLAIAAVFLVALGLVLALAPAPGEPPVPDASPTAPEPITQETMLLQVSLERVRLATLLTAIGDEPDQGLVMSLPADMLVSEGPAYTPLLDANLSLNRAQSAIAVGNTLGLRVENSWRMERKALAGLIDSVGGITVSAAEPVEFSDSTGQAVLSLPAGESLLLGPQASWYVMGEIPGEDVVNAQQERFREVILAAIVALPDDVDSVAAILTSLGALSDPLNGIASVSEYLLELREQLLADNVIYPSVPLRPSTLDDPVVTRTELEGGPAAEAGSYRVVDYPAATPELRILFRLSPRVALGGTRARVLVWNGTGIPAAQQVALEQLFDEGLLPLSAGPYETVEPATVVNGRGYNSRGVSWGTLTARALELPLGAVSGDTGTISPTPTPTISDGLPIVPEMPPPDQLPWGDVDTLLGTDYEPCPADEPNCLEEIP